jgi:outer membrane protein assembly factor BamE (lipoprotein component of BamABCDE complex)
MYNKLKLLLVCLVLAANLSAAEVVKAPAINIPKNIKGWTEDQSKFIAVLRKCKVGDTEKSVKVLLGNPLSTETKRWVYMIEEDRIEGGYFIDALLIFDAGKLIKLTVRDGHITRSNKEP